MIFIKLNYCQYLLSSQIKQLTGIESCQCRKGRIQRNHESLALFESG